MRNLLIAFVVWGVGACTRAESTSITDAAMEDSLDGDLVDGVVVDAVPPLDTRGDAPGAPDATRMDAPSGDAGSFVSVARCAMEGGERVCSGTYMASTLGAGIRDVDVGGGSTPPHFFCFPENPARWNGKLHVHFTGTGGNPSLGNGFSLLACARGFATIAPMYENARSMGSICANDSGCYENARREIAWGEDRLSSITVSAENSILNRVGTLLTRLARSEHGHPGWEMFRARFESRDLSSFVFSGHSQGAGHALFLAHDFAVERVVMLAGVTDRLGSGTPSHGRVAWIQSFVSSSPRTSPSRLLGFVHRDDGVGYFAQIVDNWDAIGAPASMCDFRVSTPAYSAGCRRIVIPAAGCGGAPAHSSVIAGRYGTASDACAQPGTLYTNDLTWEFLLTTPLS